MHSTLHPFPLLYFLLMPVHAGNNYRDPERGETRCSNSLSAGLAGARSEFARPEAIDMQQRYDAGLQYATQADNGTVRCIFGHINIGAEAGQARCPQKGVVGEDITQYTCRCLSQSDAAALVRGSTQIVFLIFLVLLAPFVLLMFVVMTPDCKQLMPDFYRFDLLLVGKASGPTSTLWLLVVMYEVYLVFEIKDQSHAYGHPESVYYSGCGYTSLFNPANKDHWLYVWSPVLFLLVLCCLFTAWASTCGRAVLESPEDNKRTAAEDAATPTAITASAASTTRELV